MPLLTARAQSLASPRGPSITAWQRDLRRSLRDLFLGSRAFVIVQTALQLCRSQALHTTISKPWPRVCLALSQRPHDQRNVLRKAIYPANCYRSTIAGDADAGLKSRRITGRLRDVTP